MARCPGFAALCEVGTVADALLWTVVPPAVVLGVLVWSSVVRELRDEFRSYRSVPTRQRARVSRSAARAIRSRVGDRSPEFARRHGVSPGRHRSPATAERAMPPAGTWRVTVPAGGPTTRHGGPVCG